jgi:hypothetical protein
VSTKLHKIRTNFQIYLKVFPKKMPQGGNPRAIHTHVDAKKRDEVRLI